LKKLAITLLIITLIVGSAFGYYLYSSTLSTTYTVKKVPATMMDDLFNEIKTDIANGEYEGVSPLGKIESYSFITMTVNADSISLFPAEWVTMSAVTVSGDVIITSQSADPDDIERFGSGTYTITLLTASAETERKAILNYYILGRNHSIYLTNVQEEKK